MNLKEYINERLRERNILEEETSKIQLATNVQREDSKIEYYEMQDENYIYKDYIYINKIGIENYGVVLDDNDEFLESNINGSNISIYADIKNHIRDLSPEVNFYGYYDGIYEYTEVMDCQKFISQIEVEGVKSSNIIFNKYKDSLAMLFECLTNLDRFELINAFEKAYTALDLLIKKIKGANSLMPLEIEEYLIRSGCDKNQAKEIRKFRNKKIIHLTEYGFSKYESEEEGLEKKAEINLKNTIMAYFKVFDKK